MATVLDPPGLKQSLTDGVLLHNVSWSTYESLLRDYEDVRNPRFTYDRGDLLIMVRSAEHEEISDAISVPIQTLAEEFGIEWRGFGSMTHKREELQRGFEPDACFYFKNEARMRGKKRLDLSVDPPPDLVVEIDITHPSINKLPLFAALGIPEVWRFDGEVVEISLLRDGNYAKVDNSSSLPLVTAEVVTAFVRESKHLGRLEWVKKMRDWARQQTEAR
ncbi:MAG TPA: Uma2 family endonuclease [Pyrinomonadaceae bacterium]|nr:Uma2 family endonuclease [Pyrinomonadaceae bacterium]